MTTTLIIILTKFASILSTCKLNTFALWAHYCADRVADGKGPNTMPQELIAKFEQLYPYN